MAQFKIKIEESGEGATINLVDDTNNGFILGTIDFTKTFSSDVEIKAGIEAFKKVFCTGKAITEVDIP